MYPDKTTFALFFGNRGFFPGSLMAEAREELPRVLKELGHEVLVLDEQATRYGGVETTREGEVYANFLRQQRGKYGGVILCLPNFGDETGAVAALKDAGVPILIQAYPDEFDKMGPAFRRDAFCGKISIMDVFTQYQIKFTAFKPHVVKPSSPAFKAQIDTFDRICRVTNGMHGLVVGAIGARTTPFKTVRVDEVTLQRHGITVETLDMADVIHQVKGLSTSSPAYHEKTEILRNYSRWDGVPDQAFENIARLGVVLDTLIEEYQMDAVAVRCWTELQQQLGISVCVLMGEMNGRGIPAACEVDIANAVAMQALHLASGQPAACFDWNNNYGEAEDRCIFFHCGPIPKELMEGPGLIVDHSILVSAVGEGCSYGCNSGRVAPTPFTFSSLLTDAGKMIAYLGQGRFTSDPIPADFFGCAGVAQIENLENVLLHIGKQGFRHHASVTPGLVQAALHEALGHYLDYEVALPQENC